jgi:hypothetical protein
MWASWWGQFTNVSQNRWTIGSAAVVGKSLEGYIAKVAKAGGKSVAVFGIVGKS